MKWVKKDYQSNEQVWYSSDLIEEIKTICRENACNYDEACPDCKCIQKLILNVIKNEDINNE